MHAIFRRGWCRAVGLGIVVAGYALLLSISAGSAPDMVAHATDADDWSGSRARCVICHSHSGHMVTMPHVTGPNCSTCHSGSPSRVGCPSCHSIHSVDTPHETYPTCASCHDASENIAEPVLSDTTAGYVAYLFGQPEGILQIEDTTSQASSE